MASPSPTAPVRSTLAKLFCAAALLNAAAASSTLGEVATPSPENASPPEAAEPSNESESSAQLQKARASARLIASDATFVPGQTATLAIVFTVDPGWHIYSNAANDTGTPPVIVESRLPEGFKLGPFQWPAAKRYLGGGDLLDHVYEGTVVLPFTIQVPADAKVNSTAKLSLDLEWLVCKNVCLFGNGTVELALPIAPSTTPPTPPTKLDAAATADAKLIRETLAALPKPLPAHAKIKADVSGGILQVSAPGAVRLEFHPAADSAPFEDLAEKGRVDGPSLSLPLRDPSANSPVVRGVLAVWTSDTTPGVYYALAFNTLASPSDATSAASEETSPSSGASTGSR